MQWASVDAEAKKRCYETLRSLVFAHKGMVEYETACKKMEDPRIQEHLIHEGWKRLRGYRKRDDKRRT